LASPLSRYSTDAPLAPLPLLHGARLAALKFANGNLFRHDLDELLHNFSPYASKTVETVLSLHRFPLPTDVPHFYRSSRCPTVIGVTRRSVREHNSPPPFYCGSPSARSVAGPKAFREGNSEPAASLEGLLIRGFQVKSWAAHHFLWSG
jgi:hypothetical protein